MNALTTKAHQIAAEAGAPHNAPMIEAQLVRSFNANRAAIKNALPCGIAGPRGCDVCGNTVEVRGYDCWACETAFDAPVRNTADLASVIGRALELQMDAERGS